MPVGYCFYKFINFYAGAPLHAQLQTTEKPRSGKLRGFLLIALYAQLRLDRAVVSIAQNPFESKGLFVL